MSFELDLEREVLQLIAVNVLRTSAQYTSVSLLSFLVCPEYMGRKMGWHKRHIFVVSLSSQECSFEIYASVWVSISGLITSECSFILRAYALWGTSQLAAAFFSFLATFLEGDDMQLSSRCSATEACQISYKSLLTASSADSGASTAIMCMVIWSKIRKYSTHATNLLLKKIYQDAVKYFCGNCSSRMILELKEYGNHTSSFSQDLAYSMPGLSMIRFGARNTQDDCEEA
ncbi:hypothetical protein P691DRAFT_788693 [Macrolepiota fuliginosa MF-IS2]|uniref:Uncharacterized protein n=1 Tax=Macrolepiota fuliginosa MF-IS2 TaxID=1400762 RepID=A0A9P5X3W4_9AGAR|nr:hypothetical protein P691DRAFT_788693 [Macrolepiota fuliginosa MF-IS2]